MLSIESLSVEYRAGRRTVQAVEDVSFEVPRGKIVALVGESGSGKSTLAHAVLGLLPHNATVRSGRIGLDDDDITSLSPKQWSRVRGGRIGFVPQDPGVALNSLALVGAQVAEALRLDGTPRETARTRALELIEEVGLPEPAVRAAQRPHQLSGGMRQRVLIAIAQARDPAYVVADEPTSALDVTVQKLILDLLVARTRARSLGLLLVTHDLGVAEDRADHIVVMHRGRVVEQGAAREVLASTHPYTSELVRAVPTVGAGRLTPRVEIRDRAVPAAEEDDVLRLDAVTKEFPLPGRGLIRALDRVSISLPRGKTLAVVGESGSGKSTLARIALRLTEPTAGEIEFDGEDLLRAPRRQLREFRKRSQFVHQNPYTSLDPRWTVERIVAEPLTNHAGRSRAAVQAKVHELLRDVALEPALARRHPTELSGGQRQRVAIARAIALEPELLVLDEPVSALDVSVQAQVLQLLVDLQAARGLSFLFISHDLAVVRQLADAVVVLRQGRVVESAPADELFDHPQDPYTLELLAAVPGRVLSSSTSALGTTDAALR